MKTFKRKKRRKNWKDPVIGLTHKEYGKLGRFVPNRFVSSSVVAFRNQTNKGCFPYKQLEKMYRTYTNCYVKKSQVKTICFSIKNITLN